MESTEIPRAIVAGHGTFPDGVVSAVDQITGKGRSLVAFSNVGLGRDEIESGMRRLIDTHGIAVIFTDLPGGSATFAARRIMHDIPMLTLVTGVNLTTLLDFVFCDGSMAPGDAARHAAEKGRASLTTTGG
ncbi:MAG: PTS sugar transporter subunit IIA [Gemmatimonadaceae bacterium]